MDSSNDDNVVDNRVLQHGTFMRIKVVSDYSDYSLSYLRAVVKGFPEYYKPAKYNNVTQVPFPPLDLVDTSNIHLQLDCFEDLSMTGAGNSWRDADGVIIVYDLSDRETFNNVLNWAGEAERFTTPAVILIIIGVHFDRQLARQVSSVEANHFKAHHCLELDELATHNATEERLRFENLLLEIMVTKNIYNDKTIPYTPIDIIRRNKRQLLQQQFEMRQHKLKAASSLATSSTLNDRISQVLQNMVVRRTIWSAVRRIHERMGVRVGKHKDNQFLFENGYYNVLRQKAARGDPLNLCDHLHNSKSSLFRFLRECTDSSLVRHVVSSLNHDTDFFREHVTEFADEACIAGNVDVLRWLHKEYGIRCSERGLRTAIVLGDLQLLIFIAEEMSCCGTSGGNNNNNNNNNSGSVGKHHKSKQQQINYLECLGEKERSALIDLSIQYKHDDIKEYIESHNNQHGGSGGSSSGGGNNNNNNNNGSNGKVGKPRLSSFYNKMKSMFK
ncbi:hypothetical protein SAMD00019534_004180 [Acytostelium subglobosum LB1]|uniref:hypothetical protein n=1 Tax=Acytostelium subglobosum LB1 TaxID=1410327 RepID=UPI000644C3EA|nr:hypothetical protein SAMD00019534_004180 [Acytostelium subglobosum LB1]GAM17243.1 hypothetical protein SAMD00019534_004180 [Acytostelium subglobosum LB1]|eukprot:XP_012759305.1 hypothetical protein SAMD00019534_004180 [Acytostelium subglobosum LB1]